MKASLRFLIASLVLTLSACSTQKVKQDAPAKPLPATPNTASSTPEPPLLSGQNPELSINKAGKKLNLVRIMDGAACKNDFEGVKGSFLIYADPQDIERIKQQKGTKVFSEFEAKIQTFSADILQNAVTATNLAEDPFALGKDEAQAKLAKNLTNNFQKAATPAVIKFKQETSLTIDINPYPPSLEFYQQGCQAALKEAFEPEVNSN